MEDISAPEEYMPFIKVLVSNNPDVATNKDTELGHINTVEMRLNTRSHSLNKLEPYITQFNNRKVIDKANDEMMEAEIIRR